MSTKIGLIAEGSIDHVLLPVLLSRIATDKVGIAWPLRTDDVADFFPLRKRGHGGVLESVRKLIRVLDQSHLYNHHCFVILLDQKTKMVQDKVCRLLSGKGRFIMGIAIKEIEAWWLGDRTNTLAWSGFQMGLPRESRYGANGYTAEKDDDPKRTLDELTNLSNNFDRCYGEGNLDLAREFAEGFWRANARLDEIAVQCPQGFKPFQQAMVNAFRPLMTPAQRRRK